MHNLRLYFNQSAERTLYSRFTGEICFSIFTKIVQPILQICPADKPVQPTDIIQLKKEENKTPPFVFFFLYRIRQ